MHRNQGWVKMLGVPSLLASLALLLAAAFAGTAAGGVLRPSMDVDTSTTTTTTSSDTTTPSPTTTPPTAPPTTPPTTTPPTTTPPTTTPPPPPPPGEGCTPGFWKSHPEAYQGTGYTLDTTLGSVFTGLPASYASLTFDQALDLGGGGLDALVRHAVAALLNASSPDVDYPLTAAEVIALTNAAIAIGDYESTKDLFDEFNNLTAPEFCN